MNKFFDTALSFVFPVRCKYCGKVIKLDKKICVECEKTLERVNGSICLKCGCEKERCNCKGKRVFYKGIVAPFYYDSCARYAVWNLKFKGYRECSKPLSEDMFAAYKKHYSDVDFDLCTYVPIDKKSLRKRNFNHAEVLASDFSDLAGLVCLPTLSKNFETRSQHKLSESERSGNLLGAFSVINIDNVKNKRILLCDDVKTTGSTLNECAKTLLIAGASEVYCLTVLVTGKKKRFKEKNTLQ
jgi:ComF family protein